MTEKEKMLSQKLYDANSDPLLLAERVQAKDLCHQYNQLRPSDAAGQQALMKQLLGKTKGAFCIVAPFWCDYGYNIEIGENFFANHNTVILDGVKVTFGDHVFVAPNCGFHTAGHPIDAGRRNKGLEYAYPITVGDNVWIGAGVQVMPGVTIGSNVVIGGGSVVVKDIPSNSVAVGNPCRVIRPITDEDKKTVLTDNSPPRGEISSKTRAVLSAPLSPASTPPDTPGLPLPAPPPSTRQHRRDPKGHAGAAFCAVCTAARSPSLP